MAGECPENDLYDQPSELPNSAICIEKDENFPCSASALATQDMGVPFGDFGHFDTSFAFQDGVKNETDSWDRIDNYGAEAQSLACENEKPSVRENSGQEPITNDWIQPAQSMTPQQQKLHYPVCGAELRDGLQHSYDLSTQVGSRLTPLSQHSIPDADPSTLSDSDLFWEQYEHGSNYGRDLYPNWKGIDTERPPRDTLRLIPEEQQRLHHIREKDGLRHLKHPNGEPVISELTSEPLFDLPFLPRYIDSRKDADSTNLDNWMWMGADMRRDIIPRSINYNRYYTIDEKTSEEVFDWEMTVAHLQRGYANKHIRRADLPSVMGGMVKKFRMDQGRFSNFLTPVQFDEEGLQHKVLISMENLLFNTRQDIDLDRMVMINPHTNRELPLFTPTEVRPSVRAHLQKEGFHVPTLRDLFTKYPHLANYNELHHPLMRRSMESDEELLAAAKHLSAHRGDICPPITNVKKYFTKQKAKSKRKVDDIEDQKERPGKRVNDLDSLHERHEDLYSRPHSPAGPTSFMGHAGMVNDNSHFSEQRNWQCQSGQVALPQAPNYSAVTYLPSQPPFRHDEILYGTDVSSGPRFTNVVNGFGQYGASMGLNSAQFDGNTDIGQPQHRSALSNTMKWPIQPPKQFWRPGLDLLLQQDDVILFPIDLFSAPAQQVSTNANAVIEQYGVPELIIGTKFTTSSQFSLFASDQPLQLAGPQSQDSPVADLGGKPDNGEANCGQNAASDRVSGLDSDLFGISLGKDQSVMGYTFEDFENWLAESKMGDWTE